MPEWKSEIRKRLAGLHLEPTAEDRIVEELALHLADDYEELLLSGLTEPEAERRALAALGESEALVRELRKVKRDVTYEPIVPGSNGVTNVLASLWLDVRYGTRILINKPAFTLIAVLTLALGIGANTAIFTVVDAALLRGLPYRDSERLVQVWETRRIGEINQLDASYPDYVDWSRATDVMEGTCGYTGWDGSFTLTGQGEPERIDGARVTANFFSVLGVAPVLGRTFLVDEDLSSAPRTVVMSYALWRRRFGADANIVGHSIVLDGNGYTVLGVLPGSFQFAPMGKAELWVPLRPSEQQLNHRFMHWLDVIARLKPGVSLVQAQARMDTIGASIEHDNADTHTGAGLKLVPLHEQIIGSLGSLLLIIFGALGCVLLIACANVANLLLARATARRQEISVRLALGATRSRLLRQLLTESVLLAAIGGVVGLLLALLGSKLLIAAIPSAQLDSMPYLQGLTLNLRVFGFAFLLTLLTGLLFGVVPAWQSLSHDIHDALKEGGRNAAGTRRRRFSSVLVVTEIALALVLTVAAGLLIKSTLRLLQVKLGFQPERLLTVQLELPGSKYSSDEKDIAFHQQLLSRIAALPGVASVGSVNWLPLQGGPGDLLRVEGQPPPAASELPKCMTHVVSADYFRTMGIALSRGRYFTDHDIQSTPAVVVINRTLARKLFGDEEAIGHRIFFEGEEPKPFEIVGVVDDERVGQLDEAPVSVVYRPYLQDPWTRLNLVVRTTDEPYSVVNAVRGEVQTLDPNLAIFSVATMEQIIAEQPSTFMRRYPALLLGLFAGVALILAAVGIYGVISCSVSQRTHEIGVRMALGARPTDVLKSVVGEGMKLTLIGVALGLTASLLLTRLLASLLFEVSATDPRMFVLISLLLSLVALVACWRPAWRATKVDPLTALRTD